MAFMGCAVTDPNKASLVLSNLPVRSCVSTYEADIVAKSYGYSKSRITLLALAIFLLTKKKSLLSVVA